MTYEATLELAARYLEAHKVPDERFGLAHTVENDDWMLMGHPFLYRDMQLSLVHSGTYRDCASMSEGLYEDISAHNPELDPRMAGGMMGGTHHWVEVRDPDSGRIIQMDATPWFACLDPGHEGVQTEYYKSPFIVPLVIVPFSVRRIGDGRFMDVAVGGSMPRTVSGRERGRGAGRWELQPDGRRVRAPGEEPAYSFIFHFMKGRGFGSVPEQSMRVLIDVLDLERLHGSLSGALSMKSLDALMASRAASIGFTTILNERSMAFVPFRSMTEMRWAARECGSGELFAEFERLVPSVLKLLSGAQAKLGIAGSPECELDVADGGVRTGDGGKYRDFVRLVESKAMGADPRKRARTR